MPISLFRLILGFNEYDGAKYYTAPLECNRYIRDAVDIFDFSQGFPGALSHLYRRRVPSEIGGYLTKQAIPALIDSGGKFSSIRYLTVLAQFCDQSVPLERYAGEALVRYEKSLPLDRRGYDLGCVLGNVLAWKYQVPRIQICRGVKMTKCSFDVNTRQLTLIFSGSREAEIVILRPRSVRRDGETVDHSSWEMGEGGTSLPIGLHTDHFVAQY